MSSTNKLRVTWINYSTLYLLAFIIVLVISMISTHLVAGLNGIETRVFHDKVHFMIDDNSQLWTYHNVVSTFSVGPASSFFTGIIFWILFLRFREAPGVLKVFFLWGFLIAFNHATASVISGIIMNTGFGNVLNWLYIRFFGKTVILLSSIAFLLTLGIMSTSTFLNASNSSTLVNGENRGLFVINGMLIPWILGTVIMILLQLPSLTVIQTAPYFTMLLIILPSVFRNKSDLVISLAKKRKKPVIESGYILLLLIALIIYRVVFGIGFSIN